MRVRILPGVRRLHATGKYVVFVDGDDRLQDTACEVLSSYASGRNFDILRFGRTVVPHGSANQDTALQEERSFNLHTEDMHGEDVAEVGVLRRFRNPQHVEPYRLHVRRRIRS